MGLLKYKYGVEQYEVTLCELLETFRGIGRRTY